MADDNFKFDENVGKLSKREEHAVGKGEIARNEQFLHFPQSFSFKDLYCIHMFGKGLTINLSFYQSVTTDDSKSSASTSDDEKSQKTIT